MSKRNTLVAWTDLGVSAYGAAKTRNMAKGLSKMDSDLTEIKDMVYKRKKQLNAELLGRGGVWLDTGSVKDFNDASNFVAAVENRQRLKIGCIEEVAFNNGWTNRQKIKNAMNFYGNCEYSKYLNLIINK